jgi:hypothetical protein
MADGALRPQAQLDKPELVARQVLRFNARFQDDILACAQLSERIADLANTFPVLMFALATEYGTLATRKRVIRLALEGRPLAELAAALALPLCFRRIPPEALRNDLHPFAWSESANRRLANHVPDDAKLAALWLQRVTFAARAGGEEFAVWIARQPGVLSNGGFELDDLLPLALHAWHSQFGEPPQQTRKRWSPRVGLDTAIERAIDWCVEQGATVLVMLDRRPAVETFEGHTLHRLMTSEALREEGREMCNCAKDYAEEVTTGCTRLYSLRRDNERLATVSVEFGRHSQTCRIGQVKLAGNRNAPQPLRLLTERWLETTVRRGPKGTLQRRWQDLLKRYMQAQARPNDIEITTFATHNMVGALHRLRLSLKASPVLQRR